MATTRLSAWSWIPSAYLAEGIPFALVGSAAGTLLKDLGHDDAEITVAIASVGIVWSLKPLYAGFLDIFWTKRAWVVGLELLMGLILVGAALALGAREPFGPLLALLWLLGAASATQDICIDGIYIAHLDGPAQARWVGLQGAFWTLGRVFVAALIVALASGLQRSGVAARAAWAAALLLAAASLVALGIYHQHSLPRAPAAPAASNARDVARTFANQWIQFLQKPHLWGMLLFVFLYRSGEGLLLLETPLFMQATTASGGLGMCATLEPSSMCPHLLADKALIDGAISTTVSLLFGLLGGAYVARTGLTRRTMMIMAVSVNLPHLTLVLLSQLAAPHQPVPLATIALLVTVEKAGYSFGMVSSIVYMMKVIAPGKYPMTHYALATSIMNLVLVPTQAASGPLSEALGYGGFFIFACIASTASLLAAWLAPLPLRG